jgi:hypothetical protein
MIKAEAVETLKSGLSGASKVLGEELQEWFRQKYLMQKHPIKDKIYMVPSMIPSGKIYMAINDNKNLPKRGYYDVFPIVFHTETVPYKNVDNMLFGINLNYFNSTQRAIFIDGAITFFGRYIEENNKRIEKGDLSQFSVEGMTEFLKGYISSMGLNVSKKSDAFIWSKLRSGTVIPIDYEDWKWIPLLIPFGVVGKSVSEIQSN